MTETTVIRTDFKPDTLVIYKAAGDEVIRIGPNGDIFWKGREIETDDQFKKCMVELANYFMGVKQ